MIIALLTDFGTRDYFVGAMKGVILSIAPTATIVDITHEIGRHDIAEASFTLRSCWQKFPTGTVFVAVVDPGVGSERRAIVIKSRERFFVGPDNGIFGFLAGEEGELEAVAVDVDRFRTGDSRTFEGRDIFAPVAAAIAGGTELHSLGDPILFQADAGESFDCIIHVDRFGNAVTSVAANELDSISSIEVSGLAISTRVVCYADSESAEPFLIAGSAGFIEISIRKEPFSERFSVRIGDPIRVLRNVF